MNNQVFFEKNYFEILGLEPHFDLDLAHLRAQYLKLQAQFHPDNFVTSSHYERQLSLQLSTFINDAYAFLKDPVKRAQYLLDIMEIASSSGVETKPDAEFLLEQMNLREEIEDADASHDTLKIKDLISCVKAKTEFYQECLTTAFTSVPCCPNKIKKLICEFQFYQKLEKELIEL